MLSSVDWLLIVVLALSALLGALRGFVAEALSMVVWIAAFWLAFAYGADAAEWLRPQVQDAAGRLLLAYALVFIVAMVAGSVVTWLVGAMVKSVGLGGLNRFLGLLYGLARGVLLGCVLVLVLGWTALPREPQWRASPLIPLYQAGAETMKEWLPEAAARHVSFAAVVEQGRQKVVKAMADQVLPSLPQEASPASSPSDGSSSEAVESAPQPKNARRHRKEASPRGG
ncbi:MAG TPA: CvpA family protein [Xanthomonadaceae bacterium]|jgi:membrane protein required for colicin V production